MNRLEVPLEFAAVRIERNDGVTKEVVSLAIEAVIIAGGAAEDCVEETALRVYRHVEAPIVHAGAILPAISRPGVIAHFTRLRYGMKFPNLRTRARVVCARVARWTGCRLLAYICADK